MNVEQLSELVHETLSRYRVLIGETAHPSWTEAGDDMRSSTRKNVTAHLDALASGRPLAASHSHDKWMEERKGAGWVYGVPRDNAMKIHPSLVPYEQLPMNERLKDHILNGLCLAYHNALMETAKPAETV